VVAAASAGPIAPVVTAPPPNPAPPAVALNVVAPTDLASLLRFVWLAVTMGLLSLLTPCILPMIPVTVSYFGGARQSPRGRAVAALAHALGIVGVFTLLGFAIATIFGAGGIVRLAASPWLNLAIAALFIAFALNLLGVFEITLPQRVLARASAIGADGHRHTAGALLMGAAFAITSFTCTVPFVGTLLVLATQGSWRWPLIGLAAYGAAFALPFVLLALAPRMLDRIPRGGEWMLTLKRSLAIAELALAVKFLSNVDLVLGARVLTRDVVLVTWIVAAGAIAVLAVRRRSAPSVAMGVLALAFAGVLVTGLRGRRLGELEAYLPPRTGGSELAWMLNDYDGALARAQAERRLVLLDFTGYTCTNCRWMEANMFPRDDVARQLERFVRVRLFTDGRGEPYATQQRFQLERFGTVALPYYAVVDGGGAPRATFLGMTRDSREFSRFLEQALSDSPGGSP
jgi:thiol:disulfide interchange protein DsbD